MSDVRAEVLRVAGETMTTAQFRVFVLHFFGGWTVARIAAEYDVAQSSAHHALWGQRKLAGTDVVGGSVKKIRAALAVHTGGGAMSKLGKALEDDDMFQGVLSSLKEAPPVSAQRSTAGWFHRCPVNEFEARAVLLVMHHVAGPSGKLHISDVMREVPARTLQEALTRLKVAGYIQTNGVDIQILKMPANPEETNDAT